MNLKNNLQTTISINAKTEIRFKKQKQTQFSNSSENETKFLLIAMTNRQQLLILIENKIEFLNDQMKKKKLTQFSTSIKKKTKFFRIIEKRSQLSISIENETKFSRILKKKFSQLLILIENEIEFTIARTNNQQFLNKIEISNDSKKKIWWKTLISKSCFSLLIADKSCFCWFYFKSRKIQQFVNWHSKQQRRKSEKKNRKKKQKKKTITFLNSKFKNKLILLLKSRAFSVLTKKKR